MGERERVRVCLAHAMEQSFHPNNNMVQTVKRINEREKTRFIQHAFMAWLEFFKPAGIIFTIDNILVESGTSSD